jgi:hypothetical protein
MAGSCLHFYPFCYQLPELARRKSATGGTRLSILCTPLCAPLWRTKALLCKWVLQPGIWHELTELLCKWVLQPVIWHELTELLCKWVLQPGIWHELTELLCKWVLQPGMN